MNGNSNMKIVNGIATLTVNDVTFSTDNFAAMTLLLFSNHSKQRQDAYNCGKPQFNSTVKGHKKNQAEMRFSKGNSYTQ